VWSEEEGANRETHHNMGNWSNFRNEYMDKVQLHFFFIDWFGKNIWCLEMH
jgi:hypothetical protein